MDGERSGRLYHALALVVVGLALVEAIYASDLLRRLPREGEPVSLWEDEVARLLRKHAPREVWPLSPKQEEAAMVVRMRATRDTLTKWGSHAFGVTPLYDVDRAMRAWERWPRATRVERFNRAVAESLARARRELWAAFAVAVGWLFSVAGAKARPGHTTGAAVAVVLSGLLTAPVVSEALWGLEMNDLFVCWHLPGVILGLGMVAVSRHPGIGSRSPGHP